MDAYNYKSNPFLQYSWMYIQRELNKAYAAFSALLVPNSSLSTIATGNWGCGIYAGNKQLKFLIQWIALSVVNQKKSDLKMEYYTFADEKLTKEIQEFVKLVNEHKITVVKMIQVLTQAEEMFNLVESKSNVFLFILKSLQIENFQEEIFL
mgnify:CR=1 FL=1